MDGEERVVDGYSSRGGGPLASVMHPDDILRGAAPFHHGVNVVGMARPRCSLAARDGGREPHYRDDAFGATLVARLRRAPGAVAEFRAAVDAALPGMYAWFRDDSLHVTLRGLVDPP